MSATAVEIGGLPIEILDLPGTSDGAPLVLLHEGLGSVGLCVSSPPSSRPPPGAG